MKRIAVCVLLIIALVASATSALAEIDFSDMSLDELLKIQEQLNIALESAQSNAVSDESAETEEPDLDTSGYIELTKGSKGEEVKALQTRLFELGFYSIAIDGDYGNGTVTAIKAFEEYNGLEQTGIATPELQAFLFSDNAKRKPVPVSSIKVSVSNPTTLVGGTLDLSEILVITPENATEKGVTFELDNETYASMDENGVLTAKERGDVIVTITSKEKTDNPKSATVKVKVLQPSKDVALNESTINIGKGSSYQLEATVGPEDADDKSVTWTSENPDIVTISSKGTVTAKGCGECNIICTTNDGSGASSTCRVIVTQLVTSIGLSDSKVNLPGVSPAKSLPQFRRRMRQIRMLFGRHLTKPSPRFQATGRLPRQRAETVK